MKLQDLLAGQEVILEIVWGKALYSITTKVIGSKDGAVLVHPIIYRGKKIELNSNDETVSFNLHHVDQKTSRRITWKNVSISVHKYKDEVYYSVKANVLGNIALNSERRANIRTRVDIGGVVTCGDSAWEVTVNDISDVGISFNISKSISLTRTDITVSFEDTVKGHSFNVNLPCRIVRSEEITNNMLKYGCSVYNPPFDVMMYTYMKRLENHNKPAVEQPSIEQQPATSETETAE